MEYVEVHSNLDTNYIEAESLIEPIVATMFELVSDAVNQISAKLEFNTCRKHIISKILRARGAVDMNGIDSFRICDNKNIHFVFSF